MEKKINLYNGIGFCEYLDHLGTDNSIVCAARTSFLGESKGAEKDRKLLNYLYRNRHTSPFEQCSITFRIKMPLFVMRQFVRHRTFRLNEWSGRYSKLKDEFYFPKSWRKQDDVNKQGSVPEEDWNPVVEHDSYTTQEIRASGVLAQVCHEAYSRYEDLLKVGVAREMARMVLPQNIMTQIVVNCDIRNLCHFLTLRQHEHAQLEIRELADAMYIIMKELFPWTAEAYETYTWELAV